MSRKHSVGDTVTRSLVKHLVFALFPCLCASAFAQERNANAQKQQQAPIRTVPVSNGFWILTGRGTNTGVSAGEDGAVLVNAGFANAQAQMLDAVSKLTSKGIRFVINTDWHDPNTSGNALMGKVGAIIVSHENVRARLAAPRFDPGDRNKQVPPYPAEGLPAVTYKDDLTLHVNGEDIYIFHPANAHSDSDSVVFFPKADVITLGDIYYSNNWPLIDLPSKGSINGDIAALDRALKLVNADTKVVPGRGPVASVKELTEYRAMFVTIRDRVLAGIKAGKNLDQILATKPTAEFEEAKKGNGELVVNRTGADFVKWAYEDLSKSAK
jgi:glyoxylase-like metal-dependent hydrolase (beta-lactamase superfamily II)